MNELRSRTERWFIQRGLPHFIEDYSARSDIFTRAMPVLGLVFLLEIFNGMRLDFPWWGNTLALAGSIGIALAAVVAVNRRRGRRPFQRPDRIGSIELIAFVVVPPLIPLVAGAGQVRVAGATLVGNLVLLAVVYLATSYGVVPTTRWAIRQTLHQLGDLANLMIRSLPLLLLFTMFLFYNAELWKVMDDLPLALYLTALGLVVAIGSAFVLVRIPRELSDISVFEDWDEVDRCAADTPVAGLLVDHERSGSPPAVSLSARSRANVGLVFFFGQSLQILLVTALIFGFYVAFGTLTILESTVVTWTASPQIDVLAQFDVAGTRLLITGELLRTAGFIATVAGLQFTVSALVDRNYREEFLSEMVGQIRTALAARLIYLNLVVDRPADDAAIPDARTLGAWPSKTQPPTSA